ncbi:MAG: hypothetical protein F6K55_19955 [Moorea sp. SIO4A3]|nr:hypothetical protein [Moorena sp. SIO4A3]
MTVEASTCNNLQHQTTLANRPRDRVQPVTTLAFGHAIAFNLQSVTTFNQTTFNQTTFNL